MDAINRTSKLPLYQQIYEILRTELARGVWQPGDLMPTETDLVERFSVSRIIVRQALDMLVKDGLIYRQRGKGTFVCASPDPAGADPHHQLHGRHAPPRLHARALTSSSAELLPAPPAIARAVACRPRAKSWRTSSACAWPTGSRSLSKIPTSSIATVPASSITIMRPTRLRETLEGIYGLRMARASQTIQGDPRAPLRWPSRSASKRNAPLLSIERTSFSDQGIPVEFLRIYYRGDRYALYGELSG